MKLTIDIGNTSISVGLFNNKNLVKKKYFSTIDIFIEFIEKIDISKIECAIISSVVPKLTIEYRELLEYKYQLSTTIIDYKLSRLDLIVENKESVGADRLCNIYAAIQEYTTPTIIIDFGTATTYDVINDKNQFIGGSIAAGIETSAKYLIDKGALLSSTQLIFPDCAIGKNTTTNIQSGIMFGAIDQVQGMINRITKETNATYTIILTGGFSNLISPKLSFKHIIDLDLTLKGILYIYESNN